VLLDASNVSNQIPHNDFSAILDSEMQWSELTGILNSIVHVHLYSEQKEHTLDIATLNGNVQKITTFAIELQ
jgi:hypothetical protein